MEISYIESCACAHITCTTLNEKKKCNAFPNFTLVCGPPFFYRVKSPFFACLRNSDVGNSENTSIKELVSVRVLFLLRVV